MERDPYRVLGLREGSSQEEIKRAYRRLARRHHPDKNSEDPAAKDKFFEVQRAYDILRGERPLLKREAHGVKRSEKYGAARHDEAQPERDDLRAHAARRTQPEGNTFRTEYMHPSDPLQACKDMWGSKCGQCADCSRIQSRAQDTRERFAAMMKASPLIFGAKVTTRKTGMFDPVRRK
jgi:DnaJ-class molecular chaperone